MSKLDTYFLEVSAHVLLKLAAKYSIRSKKSKNLVFLLCFFKAKTEECNKKKLKCLQKIWHHYILFNYLLSGNECTRFTESSHQSFFNT